MGDLKPPNIPSQLMERACNHCIGMEKQAYGEQAKYLFPNDKDKQQEFVQAGLCLIEVCPTQLNRGRPTEVPDSW